MAAFGPNNQARRDDFHPDNRVFGVIQSRVFDAFSAARVLGEHGFTVNRDGEEITARIVEDAIPTLRTSQDGVWLIGGAEPGIEGRVTGDEWQAGARMHSIAYTLHKFSFASCPVYGDGRQAYAGFWVTYDAESDAFSWYIDATTVHVATRAEAIAIAAKRNQISAYDAYTNTLAYTSGAATMHTYAVQSAEPSGETFVVEYNQRNEAVAICGPLDPGEREQANSAIAEAASFDYEPIEPGSWNWQPPIATYDPNTGEVWRA